MQWFNNLRTSLKISMGFAMIILLQVLTLTAGYKSMSTLQNSEESLYKNEYALVTNLLSFLDKESTSRADSLMMISSKTPAEQEKFHESIKKMTEDAHTILEVVS